MPNDVFSQQESNSPPQLNHPLQAGLSEITEELIAAFQPLNLSVKIPYSCLLPRLHCGGGCSYQGFMGFVYFSSFYNNFGQVDLPFSGVFFPPHGFLSCAALCTRNHSLL